MQNKIKILPVVFCPDHNIKDAPDFDTVHSLDNINHLEFTNDNRLKIVFDNGDFIDYWTK
jgi:hypothetical protein